MAVNNKRSAKDIRFTKAKLDLIWDKATTNFWYTTIKTYHPDKYVEEKGDSIRSQCLYHVGDSDPSFFIDTNKKIAKCFSARCGKYETDPVALYAKVTKQSYYDAAFELADKYEIKLLSKKDLGLLKEHQEAFETCELFHDLCHKSLVDAFNDIENEDNEYAKPLVAYLKKRGIDLMEGVLPIGIIPPHKIIPKILPEISSEQITKIHDLLNSLEGIKYLGQLVSTYRYSLDKISGFKIRRVTALFGKEEDTGQKDIFTLRHPNLKDYTDEPSFFGLEHYRNEVGNQEEAIIVEGEFDYLSLVQGQTTYGYDKKIIIATGGGTSGEDLNSIHRNFGINRFFLLMDSPEAKGDELAYKIVRSHNGIMQPYIFSWDTPLIGNDPDELVTKNEDFHAVYNTITSIENYYNEEQFIIKKIVSKIKDQEEEHGSISDKIKVKYTSLELQSIKDPTLARTCVTKICKTLEIPEVAVTELFTPFEDNEDSFLKRFSQLWNRTYKCLGIMTNYKSSEADLLIWSLVKKYEYRVSCARLKETQTLLAEETGSIYKWINKHIGIPSFLEFIGSGDKIDRRKRFDIEKDLRSYLGTIITDSMEGLKQISENDRQRGGVFYLPPKNDSNGEKTWYVHNGSNLFKGVLNDTNKLRFSKINIPVDKGHYFNLSMRDEEDKDSVLWSKWAVSETNMNAELLTLRELIDANIKIMNSCYNFKHKVDYLVLGIICAYYSIYPLFERRLFLSINGETSSGKTRLGQGTFGGKSHPDLQIVEAVNNIAHYSEAGIRQNSNNRNLTLSLDEFEDKGKNDEKSITVRKILDTFRTADTKTKVVKGSPTGDAKTFSINCPILTIGVRPMTEAMDVNRYINVTTEKKEGFQDALVLLRKIMSKEDVDTVRASNTVVPMRYTNDIVKMEQEIEYRINSGTTTYKGIPHRTLSQLVPLASIYATAYNSVKKGIEFIEMYIDDHASELRNALNVGHTPRLWTDFLRSQTFRLGRPEDTNRLIIDYTMNAILQTKHLREQLIDRTINGVRLHISDEPIIKDRKYIIFISWPEARTVFPLGSEFRTYPSHKLKTVADRDPNVLTVRDIKKSVKQWKYVMRDNNNFDEITAIEVTDIVARGDLQIEKKIEDVITVPSKNREQAKVNDIEPILDSSMEDF